MLTILLALFGCPHERETFPRTVRDEYGRARCYVVCLSCGQETEYDFARMRRGKPEPTPRGETAEEVA